MCSPKDSEISLENPSGVAIDLSNPLSVVGLTGHPPDDSGGLAEEVEGHTALGGTPIELDRQAGEGLMADIQTESMTGIKEKAIREVSTQHPIDQSMVAKPMKVSFRDMVRGSTYGVPVATVIPELEVDVNKDDVVLGRYDALILGEDVPSVLNNPTPDMVLELIKGGELTKKVDDVNLLVKELKTDRLAKASKMREKPIVVIENQETMRHSKMIFLKGSSSGNKGKRLNEKSGGAAVCNVTSVARHEPTNVASIGVIVHVPSKLNPSNHSAVKIVSKNQSASEEQVRRVGKMRREPSKGPESKDRNKVVVDDWVQEMLKSLLKTGSENMMCTTLEKLDVVALMEPRISGRRADAIISHHGFASSYQVEARGSFVLVTFVYASHNGSKRRDLWPQLSALKPIDNVS
ncbi:hypothetical protein V6N11_043247 [Hibiscus sabdariffa]|uniref:Uncharacterized protein n=1 Tax=Hibiscus sabdariffa TaxID=183260 RepID=A0ABR2QZH4_9ROSI